MKDPCYDVQPYFYFGPNSISNYTQGQASASYTLYAGDDVSDNLGVPGSCGSYSFLEHNIGDLMTVTAINSTAFTVTIGDPSLEFDDTADKLIGFQIRVLLWGGPAEVPDTEWTVENEFWLTMEYCLELFVSVSAPEFYSINNPTSTLSIPVTFALEGDCAPV